MCLFRTISDRISQICRGNYNHNSGFIKIFTISKLLNDQGTASRMLEIDKFYREMTSQVSKALDKQRKNDVELSEEETWLRTYATLHGFKGDENYVANTLADVGLLLMGAKKTAELQAKPCDLANKPDIEGLLNIYSEQLGEPVKSLMENVSHAFGFYRKLTGKTSGDFMKLMNDAWKTAIEKFPNIELPVENAGIFYLKAVERSHLPDDILKLEEIYLNTTLDGCLKKIEQGELSTFTIPVVNELTVKVMTPLEWARDKQKVDEIADKAHQIEFLTAIPCHSVVADFGKISFPLSHEFKGDEQKIRDAVTKGLDVYLEFLYDYHTKEKENYWLKESYLPYYGEDGIFFCDNARKIPMSAKNKRDLKSPVAIASKIHVLANEWADWSQVKEETRKWFEKAVNEVAENEIRSLEILKGEGKLRENLYYRHSPILRSCKTFIKPELYQKYEALAPNTSS